MCRVLRVLPSGYYAWRKGPWLARRLADELLALHIMDVFLRSHETYGSPRVHVELQAAGIPVSRKRVARVMRDHELVARRPARRVRTTNSDHAEPIAPNLVARAFAVAANPTVDRVWVGDITYVPTAAGWLYLAIVLDLASRRCIGWAMRDSLETDVVSSALQMAVATRQPAPGLIFHSDRGVQYASGEYRGRLAAHGMVASMSRKGDCWDNAVAESFFATLEHELIAREQWATHAEARRAIFAFIETWYNRERRHSTLGYRSPATYEKEVLGAAA
jgi:transposase InsO family protein